MDYMKDLNYGQLWWKTSFSNSSIDCIEGRIYASISICEYRLNSSLNEFDSFICGDNYGRIFLFHG